MPIVTPVIVQQASLSNDNNGQTALTLPNPVTVGNILVVLACGGGGGGGGSPEVRPSGFSSVLSEATNDDTCSPAIYVMTAQSAIPPVITVPWGGFSSQGATLLEVANAGSVSGVWGSVSVSDDTVTMSQAGSVVEVASLYLGISSDVTGGLLYSNPEPPGSSIGAVLNGVSVFEGVSWTAVQLVTTSNNPVSFQYTQSAPPVVTAGGQYCAVLVILAGEQTVGPPVPPENLAQPIGTQDVVYAVVERIAVRAGVPYRYYTVEVMASRLLGGNLAQAVPNDIEYSWAVDAGVQVAPSQPAANLWITPGNVGAISEIDIVLGGDDYPSVVVATIVDLVGSGAGAAVTFTVTDGVITAYDLTEPGAAYVQPEIQLAPSAGDGAVLTASVSNTCTIYADAAIWTAGDVGQIIRAAGGNLQIVSVTDTQHVVCNVLEPFTQFIPNTAQPASCLSGQWTQGPQITQLPYLDHLEGMSVMGLADGAVIGPLTVTNGAIALPNPASIVTAGLGFTAQLKTLRIDLGGQGGSTVQSKRKKVSATTLRVQDTQGLMVGSTWARMTPIRPAGFAPSNAALPFSQGGGNQDVAMNGLYSQEPVTYLDQRILMDPNWDTDGQICIQQSNPLPMSILAIIPEITIGDS